MTGAPEGATPEIAVLFFSVLEDVTGCREWPCPWRDGDTPASVLERAVAQWPGLAAHRASLLPAVNRAYESWSTPVSPGDELAFLPPVQGG